jgi:hypothetical protein
MKRFLAVVGVVAFVAACSDSSSTGPLRASSGVAAHSPGDPPPPPLSGADGSGFLDVGFSSDVVASAQPAIPCNHDFSLNFTWSYLQANGSTNQVVHLNLTGSSSGNIDLHDIQNGKVITHGTISDGSFSFTIQGTDNLDLSSEGFDAQVTGTLTQLPNGPTCQATAQLHGTFVPD